LTNLNSVKAVYAAFATGDIPAVLGALSPDIAWTEAEGFPLAGTYIGPRAVLEGVFMRLGSEWQGFAAVPDEFIDGGDTVVVLGKYSGKYKATGKSFQANFAHVWKMKDGKAAQFIQYTDTLLVHRALQ
jgi:uncharacterized protein